MDEIIYIEKEDDRRPLPIATAPIQLPTIKLVAAARPPLVNIATGTVAASSNDPFVRRRHTAAGHEEGGRRREKVPSKNAHTQLCAEGGTDVGRKASAAVRRRQMLIAQCAQRHFR
uniref:Uncharacterized protein n=1 Tax=Plectus sambesii TaxID=2011161 RepID=A0A914V9C9_9BILA